MHSVLRPLQCKRVTRNHKRRAALSAGQSQLLDAAEEHLNCGTARDRPKNRPREQRGKPTGKAIIRIHPCRVIAVTGSAGPFTAGFSVPFRIAPTKACPNAKPPPSVRTSAFESERFQLSDENCPLEVVRLWRSSRSSKANSERSWAGPGPEGPESSLRARRPQMFTGESCLFYSTGTSIRSPGKTSLMPGSLSSRDFPPGKGCSLNSTRTFRSGSSSARKLATCSSEYFVCRSTRVLGSTPFHDANHPGP